MRGEVDWRHVNFFGGARTAGIFARYSALDRGVRLNFRQPYFFSPRYSFGMSGQSWFSDEPAYELTTVGGRVTIAREFTRARSVLAPRQSTDAGADLCERVGGLHDLRGSARRSDVPRRADRARPRSRNRNRARASCRRCCSMPAATRPITCSTPRRATSRASTSRPPGSGSAGTSTTTRSRQRAATTRRSAAARWSRYGPVRARLTRLDPKTSSCRSSSATSSAARRTSAAGVATRSRR